MTWKISQAPMPSGFYTTTDSLLWHAGRARADFERIFWRGPCLTKASITARSDSSDGIIGNIKIDNYGGGGSYLSRLR